MTIVGWLQNASIRTKILALVMLVTSVTLVLASGSLLAWDYRQFRIDIARELSSQARMVIENSAAAISFQDRTAANETLETLSANPHIRVACLYDANGQLFTAFAPGSNASACPSSPPLIDYVIGSVSVTAVASARVAGSPAGSVFLESDLEAVSSRTHVQAVTAGLVLIISVFVALLLSTNFQHLISGPIDALVQTARDVSADNDYSLRAKKTTGDELGVLVDAFNGMLTQIERSESDRAQLLARERETNRLKDEFLMTLSHELRTPLNAIQGWTNLLTIGAIPATEVPAVLQRIERNVHAQARLVEDLLEVSRFAAGKFRLETTTVDFIAIARQTIESLTPTADARRISIDTRIDLAAAPMTGDPNRLQQVIWNLLSNAIKFSAPDTTVTVNIRAVADQCELIVADTGIGIDAAFLPHVFEAFRQADASTTRAHGGLGLGLSLVKRIVDLHGGRISAQSSGAGQGATFVVRLPLGAGTANTALHSSAAPVLRDNSLSGVTVLVVDDDDDSRELVATLVETAGAHVERAAGALEALRIARTLSPDVVISDIAMPDQDGHALLAALQRLPGRGPRVAIALTAQATQTERDRALESGFTRHIAKPFDPAALLATIREGLQR